MVGETERRRAEHPPAPFLWHSKASSQVLGMGTSFIYFCPPDALCRQRSHLCQGALAGGQTPQSHQIPPKHSPLSQSSPILLFPPFQRTWMLRVGPGSAPTLPGLGDVSSCALLRHWQEKLCSLSTSALVWGWLLVFLCLPRGMILNGPYLSRENIDPEF